MYVSCRFIASGSISVMRYNNNPPIELNAAYASTPLPSAPTASSLDTTAPSAPIQQPAAGALSDTPLGITPAPQLPVVFAVALAVTLLSGVLIAEALTTPTLLLVATAPPVQSVMSRRRLRRQCRTILSLHPTASPLLCGPGWSFSFLVFISFLIVSHLWYTLYRG